MEETIATETDDIENSTENESLIAKIRRMSDHEIQNSPAYPARQRKLLGKSSQ